MNFDLCGGLIVPNYGHLCPESYRKATLRDQFAMATLTGILAAGNPDRLAPVRCYQIADNMIDARKLKNSGED